MLFGRAAVVARQQADICQGKRDLPLDRLGALPALVRIVETLRCNGSLVAAEEGGKTLLTGLARCGCALLAGGAGDGIVSIIVRAACRP